MLPELPPGVLVGIHDVYGAARATNYWSEQYLLACYLIGQSTWLRTVLPCWYVSTHPRLGDLARPLFPEAASRAGNPHGLTFWLQTAPQG